MFRVFYFYFCDLGEPHLARPYNCVPRWCWWWAAKNCCWLRSATAVRVFHFVWWELRAQDGCGYCVKENQCKNLCIPGQLLFSQLTYQSKMHHIHSYRFVELARVLSEHRWSAKCTGWWCWMCNCWRQNVLVHKNNHILFSFASSSVSYKLWTLFLVLLEMISFEEM